MRRYPPRLLPRLLSPKFSTLEKRLRDRSIKVGKIRFIAGGNRLKKICADLGKKFSTPTLIEGLFFHKSFRSPLYARIVFKSSRQSII